MSKKHHILIILIIISNSILGQDNDVQMDSKTINLQPSEQVERKVDNDILMIIKLCGLRGRPHDKELAAFEDSLIYHEMDSCNLRLKSGTNWDPRHDPPQSRFLLMKLATKSDTVNTKNRINYLESISESESNGLAFELIDKIYFRNSYYNDDHDKLMTIDFELLPDPNTNLGMTIANRKIIYSNTDN